MDKIEKTIMKADLTLLHRMEQFSTEQEQRDFALSIRMPWEEYLYLKQKYRMVLERYRDEQKAIQ